MISYHGTHHRLAGSLSDLCMTSDYDAAAEYVEGAGGCVYTIEIASSARLADDDDLIATADELGIADEYSLPYDYADEAAVREALAARGYDGVRYEDCAMTTYGGTHDTVRVWDGQHLTITGSETIEEIA